MQPIIIGGEPEPSYARMAIPYYPIDSIKEAGSKFLIATGSRSTNPPIPSLDLSRVHSRWTLQNVRQIIASGVWKQKLIEIPTGLILAYIACTPEPGVA
jgi:NADPH-dependent 2,4-dienoyl-CoA reductase/sulfur reductase-like enzyme